MANNQKNQPKCSQPGCPTTKAVAQPTPEQISKRAHEIYLARGGTPGSELGDWLQAERELKR